MRRLLLAALVCVITACASGAPVAPEGTPFRLATLLTQTRTPTPTSVGTGSPPSFSGSATIEMGDQWFLPEQVIVTVGTTVLWINRGQLAHTATARDGSFDSRNLEFGRSFTFTFTKPGRYFYSCALHGDMIGEVDVR